MIANAKRAAKDRKIISSRNKIRAIWEVVIRESGKKASKENKNIVLLMVDIIKKCRT